MQNYLRGTIFLPKNTYIKGVFKIIKGTISEKNNQKTRKLYQKDDLLFLEYITLDFALYDYYVEELTTGYWIERDKIYNDTTYFQELAKINYANSVHLELLLIKDPITCFCRFLHITANQKKLPCFYIDMNMKELYDYLKIEKRQLNQIIAFLINKNIITRQNKLWIIHDQEALLSYAYKEDY